MKIKTRQAEAFPAVRSLSAREPTHPIEVVTPLKHQDHSAPCFQGNLKYDFGLALQEESVSSRPLAYAQKRRSTRIDLALPLEVQGVGALREPYHEKVSTLSVSCHGCTYQTKHEVIQGEVVFLEVQPSSNATAGSSSRARVKWVQKITTADRGFRVAVELESAGNIWGVPTPPEDWFAVQKAGAEESVNGRELHVVARTEQKIAPIASGISAPGAGIEKTNAASPQLSSLAHLMAGLGEQIQIKAGEAARDALTREKDRQMDEFRVQLRDEAMKTMESVITASKEEISHQALKGLMQAHEAGARINYTRWIKKIEQDMETVRQHMLNQVGEVNRRIDSLAADAIDRVQRNVETTRNEAVERFVSRFREEVTPLVVQANEALQTLAASEVAFKKESETIYAGMESHLECCANASVTKVHEELTKNSMAIAAQTNETMQHLARNIEKTAQENLQMLLTSVGTYATTILEERTAQLSREFSSGLEGYTRNYLEALGKSIAELPRPIPGSPDNS
jgi:hypothetical protein